MAVAIAVAASSVTGCSGEGETASFEALSRALDEYPLPASFRFLSEKRYQFGVGPTGEANAIARYYEPGVVTSDVRAVVTSTFTDDVKVSDEPPDEPGTGHVEGRLTTRFRGVTVVVFTAARPVEVRAYDVG